MWISIHLSSHHFPSLSSLHIYLSIHLSIFLGYWLAGNQLFISSFCSDQIKSIYNTTRGLWMIGWISICGWEGVDRSPLIGEMRLRGRLVDWKHHRLDVFMAPSRSHYESDPKCRLGRTFHFEGFKNCYGTRLMNPMLLLLLTVIIKRLVWRKWLTWSM